MIRFGTLKYKLFILKNIFVLLLTTYQVNALSVTWPTKNVWDVLSQQFSLNHEVNRPEVQQQIKWILKHPGYLKQITNQSRPYIYFVANEIQKRKLPGELALVPMIESGYNPFAYSGAGASGLWQMMPTTGADLGLSQDWWADHRRSVVLSTTAALKYLQYLHKFFNGNWTYAIAAYDSGEGKMARSIKQSRNKQFWYLPLPRETKSYIPRIMALAEVIANHKKYNIHLPDIPYKPYFVEVRVDNQIDLNKAAKLADIPYQELISLNPSYNRWATSPFKSVKLLVPIQHADSFSKNINKVPKESLVNFTKHKVQSNESIASIANKYNSTTNLLKNINLIKSDKIKVGQTLFIPSSSNVTADTKDNNKNKSDQPKFINPSQYRVLHIVDEGESMDYIQNKYNVSAAEIRAWNQLDTNEKINPGQQLVIWKNDNLLKHIYIVRKGDSLSRIAHNNNLTVNKIRQLNPNIKEKNLRLGQSINIG